MSGKSDIVAAEIDFASFHCPTRKETGVLGKPLCVRRTHSAPPSASFYMVPHGGHRSAPRMLAALAGVVHDRQRSDNHEHNRDEDYD
jgi:hypothetical protein